MHEGKSCSLLHQLQVSGRQLFIVLATGLLLLILPLSLVAKEKVKLSLTDTTIFAVIDELRSQTDIDFIFNHEALEECVSITIHTDGASVEEVLEICLKDCGLTFQKIKQTIIIVPLDKEAVMQRLISGSIKGQVVDEASRAGLPYATVLLVDKVAIRGVACDEQGYFRMGNLPPGRHTLQVSFVGYREKMIQELFVGSSKEVNIIVSMEEKIDSLGEIPVGMGKGEALNQMAVVSSRSFSVEETKRYAASMSDPARMAQVFAGVTGNDDATNEIVIRGNSPNWMQWRLEGVEIPSPNHFSEEGYTSGAVSILSADMLATSDFYMGAFPAEFGNALSGVFDLRLRNGNNENYEFSAQAGILGFDFSAEGPFSKTYDGSFLVNYRYSSLALLDRVNIRISENAVPEYQDLSFKINLPTTKAGTFSLWAIGGQSEVLEEYLNVQEENGRVSGYRDFTRTGMYALGVTHTLVPDSRSYLRTVVSHAYNYSGELFEVTDNRGVLALDLEDELQNDALRITSLYNRKISQQFTFRTGFTWNNTGYNYLSNLVDEEGTLRTFLNGSGRTDLFQAYVQGKYRISDRLSATGGLHYAWFALSNDHSLEPRLGVQLLLDRQQKLTFGYGRHSKNEDLPVYLVDNVDENGNHFNPNIDLKMTRASHYILGYEKMLTGDLQLKLETYYQHINNLPVPTNPEKYWPPFFGNIFFDTLANTGKSRNYGLELTLQKFFTNNYYLLFTSSLFDAKYQPANGLWYNSRYNSNYASNLVGGKEFHIGEKQLLGVNAKLIWYGGKRILPLDLEASIEKGEAVFVMEEIFAKKGPDYFRIDVGLNWHLFREKSEHVLSINIQNMTNRKNVFSEEYDPVNQQLTHYYLAGLIPIVHYRIEF